MVRLKELRARLERSQDGPRARIEGGRRPRRRSAQARRAGLPSQDDRRADLHHRGRHAPARAPDRQQPDRARRSRSARRSSRSSIVDSEPRYEFRYLKNYLERDETIDLNVVLLSSDPDYSEQDRSALADVSRPPRTTCSLRRRALRRCRHQLPEPVADAEPGRVRHRERGRRPVHRRRAVQPAVLSRHAAGAAAADRAFRRAQPDGRRHERHVVPARADARRTRQPDLPLRRRRSRRACRSGRGCPSFSGTSRPRARSRRRWCWPSTRR